tara:strand:- start:251 stop:493 length:243 start_codon:yes stop_codon:yes gene_type:complete
MQNTQVLTNTFNDCSLTATFSALDNAGCSAGVPAFVRIPLHRFTFHVYEIQQILTLIRIDPVGERFCAFHSEAAETGFEM